MNPKRDSNPTITEVKGTWFDDDATVKFRLKIIIR